MRACPVCHNALQKTSAQSRVFCGAECATEAKRHSRKNGVRVCHKCLRWRKSKSFDLAGYLCYKCRKPERRVRRAFKTPKKCQFCERSFKPHCNAQKFCRVKCREQNSDREAQSPVP